MDSGWDLPCGRGFPIRTSADQRSLASPRGLSQRATSFIASWRQGIHRTPFIHSIRHRPHAGPTRARSRPIPGSDSTYATRTTRSSSPVKEHRIGTNPRVRTATGASRPHHPEDIPARPAREGRGSAQGMETVGFEPTAPCLQSRCSPTELRPRPAKGSARQITTTVNPATSLQGTPGHGPGRT